MKVQNLILIILLPYYCSAQLFSKDNKLGVAFKTGYSFQKSGFAEIGILTVYNKVRPCNDTTNSSAIFFGPSIGSEFKFSKNNVILAPKAGFEYYNTDKLCAVRLNITDYTNLKKSDIRIVPEIGYSLIGIVNLFYGYSFHLTKSYFNEVGNHKISLLINIPFFYLKKQ